MSDFELSRRNFVVTAAVAAASVSIANEKIKPSAASEAPKALKKGKLVKGRKINIACVGVGGVGERDALHWEDENVVALCDVDERMSTKTRERYPDAEFYQDYREMFAKCGDKFDAVTIATPDHMHYPIALAAIQMGKHVFMQKPLAQTVTEMRALAKMAKLHDVKTQMCNQGHSNEGTRLCKEWITAGLIGDVTRVDVWTNRPVWPQNCQLPADVQQVPEGLDWNLWQGVAAERPYNECYLPLKWRGWWDYGCGATGDACGHTMDAMYWALELGAPSRVELTAIEGGTEWSAPAGLSLKYHFPKRGGFPACVVNWYEGTKRPPLPQGLGEGVKLDPAGQLFYGSKGFLYAVGDYCNSVRLLPDAFMESVKDKLPAKTLPRIERGDHYNNWLDAIRGKVDEACSHFGYSAGLSELGALGSMAARAGRSFDWDAAQAKASDPLAQRYVTKTYRVF